MFLSQLRQSSFASLFCALYCSFNPINYPIADAAALVIRHSNCACGAGDKLPLSDIIEIESFKGGDGVGYLLELI